MSITKYFNFLHEHIEKHLIVNAVILWLQIPHMVWAGDAYLQTGLMSRLNPVLDFALYGIDLLEIISIVYITSVVIAEIKQKRLGKKTPF